MVKVTQQSVDTDMRGYAGIKPDLEDVKSQLAQKAKEHWVDVTKYGAKGDGVNDDTNSIQQAIDSISGGTVFVPYTSAYYKTTKALVLPSNVTLLGDWNRPKIKQEGSGVDVTNGAVIINKGLLNSTIDANIHIANLTLENQYQNFLTSDNSIPMYFYGIKLGGVTRFSIRNCYVLNTIAEGIYLGGTNLNLCEDGVVEGNRIENSCASSIAVTNGKKIRIKNNLCLNSRVFGIDIEPNTNCFGAELVIEGNTVDTVNAGYYKNRPDQLQHNALGISVNAGSLPDQAYEVVISGNTVKNVKRYTITSLIDFASIAVIGGKRVVVTSNAISDSDSCGVVVRSSYDVAVSSNTIKNTYESAIRVSSSQNINVGRNVINSPANGMRIESALYLAIVGNTIYNPTGYGMRIQSSTDVTVSSNVMTDDRASGSRLMQYGIYIMGGNDRVITTGNIIHNSTSDQIRDVDSSTNTMNSGNLEDTAWRIKNANLHIYSDGNIYQVGWVKPKAIVASSASNGSVFVDSADNKLKFKDSAGVVNLLY